MKPGELNRLVTLTPLTSALTAGEDVTTEGTPVTVRAKITQIDGTRYLKAEELVDRAVFRIETWNNNYVTNLKITYGTLTMYPVRPPTINPDRSGRDIIVIIAATKK